MVDFVKSLSKVQHEDICVLAFCKFLEMSSTNSMSCVSQEWPFRNPCCSGYRMLFSSPCLVKEGHLFSIVFISKFLGCWFKWQFKKKWYSSSKILLQVVQSLCWRGILIYRPVSICKQWSLVRNLAMSCLFLEVFFLYQILFQNNIMFYFIIQIKLLKELFLIINYCFYMYFFTFILMFKINVVITRLQIYKN